MPLEVPAVIVLAAMVALLGLGGRKIVLRSESKKRNDVGQATEATSFPLCRVFR